MLVFRIVMATLIGTTLMTLFSYVLSHLLAKQFREPELLNKLLYRLPRMRKRKKMYAFGWVAHYLVGLIFNIIYWLILPADEYSLIVFLVLGAISGVFGCVIWEITFTVHPRPPHVHLSKFYIQLFFAHILFGFGSWVAYHSLW